MSRRIPAILRQARPNFRSSPRSGTELSKRVIEDPSRMGVASKYFVADLPGAITPATRLHNILASLEQGRRLSEQALMYLQNQELAALKQLAQGEISYDAFSQIAAEELVKREQVAEAERRKKRSGAVATI